MSERAPLREQLAALPTDPGVYTYRDADERVLYVGKAKSLRKRVLSYFQAPLRPDGSSAPDAPIGARSGLHPKITDLVARIASVDVFVTGSESEALILEGTLVKRHRPPFNVRLRDDKSYPYIAISLDEEFPRVYFTPRAAPARPALLRPVLERLQGARDPEPDREDLPDPPVRGPRARAAVRRPLPRLPHQAVPGAVRRLHRPRGSTRS